MRRVTLLVGVLMILGLIVPAAQAQTVPPTDVSDFDAGNYVGELLVQGDFNPTLPMAWYTAFAQASAYDTAAAFATMAATKDQVFVKPGSTPSRGVVAVLLEDGTLVGFSYLLNKPSTPQNPSFVEVTYMFPNGTMITVFISDVGNGPVVEIE